MNGMTFMETLACVARKPQPRPQGFPLKKWVGREKDRFVFNYLAVDSAGQTADNKLTGSLIFPFFLLAS